MAMTKHKNERLITPKGELQYAWLTTADTKFNPTGVYKTNLKLEQTEATEKLVGSIEAIFEEAYANNDKVKALKAKGKKVLKAPFYEELEDGSFEFRFKQNKLIPNKQDESNPYTAKIAIFDNKAVPVVASKAKNLKIGNGTVAKVCFEVVPYFVASTKTFGVTLRLCSVQIIKLVEYEGGSSNPGFGAEDGDFSSESLSDTSGFEAEADEEEDSEDYNF